MVLLYVWNIPFYCLLLLLLPLAIKVKLRLSPYPTNIERVVDLQVISG